MCEESINECPSIHTYNHRFLGGKMLFGHFNAFRSLIVRQFHRFIFWSLGTYALQNVLIHALIT